MSDFDPVAAQKEIDDLVERSQRIVRRIDKLGAEIDNVDQARDQYLAGWIYNNVLTEQQKMAFDKAWLEHLITMLTDMEGKAREVFAARTRARLGATNPPGLIVPEHLRRPGS